MDFYNKAATALDLLDLRRGSLKGIVFRLATPSSHSTNSFHSSHNLPSPSPRHISNAKRLLRVVAQTLNHRQTIRLILKNSNLLIKEKKIFAQPPTTHSTKTSRRPFSTNPYYPNPESLATILLHDFFFAPRGISLSKLHKLRHAVEAHSLLLHAELAKLNIPPLLGLYQNTPLVTPPPPPSCPQPPSQKIPPSNASPRWIRVNTIKWSLQQALDWLLDSGWSETQLDALSHQPTTPNLLLFARDIHLPCLLALSPSVLLSDLAPYQDGRFIAQDKASCMPPQLLLGDFNFSKLNQPICVIDATAAPGNKTTMLSALVGQNGKVWAFEKDPQRYITLKQMVSKAGCNNVECVLGDFMSVKTNDPRFHNLTHILLDPSCSGSGISNRLDHLVKSQPDPARIQSLAKFQTTILSHALRFNSVLQVAYSTCSIWREEDEDVVLRVLQKPEMSKKGWRLKDLSHLLATRQPWQRPGTPRTPADKQHTDRMMRFDPMLDKTIGFFAAVFIRPLTSPKNQPSRLDITTSHSSLASKTTLRAKSSCGKQGKRWRGIRPGKLLYFSSGP